jgi:uncharacterized phage protein (TIGR02218 family)
MRTISAELQEHLDSGATTTTLLLRIDPVTPGYASVGATLLDRDVVYDDGDGEVTYKATIGMVPSNIVSKASMEVGNTEIQHLLPESDLPISEADISAGVYDFASYTLMLVNYEDLSMGHVIMPSGHGQLGQMRQENGLSFWSELTALVKLLKQSIVEKDSLTCRAIFGSQPLGTEDTSGDVITQRFPCGKDTSAMWVVGTVSAVSLETNRAFTAGALGAATDVYVPGMLRWLTGANSGRSYEVESQTAGGVIGLTFETMFPIETGDTFQIRPDCTKWKDGNNGCKFHFDTEWVLHYRGEPLIPVADADQINAPGASMTSGPWATTTVNEA